jgi:hypothetical protein
MVDGRSFRLADEVRYIQRRAAEHDERIVIVGQLVLFSTETGDAWLLDALDHLATRLARDGDPELIYIEDTDTTFAIEWKGQFHIEGGTFVYVEGHRPGDSYLRLPNAKARSAWIAPRAHAE